MSRRPCHNCPFRSDRSFGGFTRNRAIALVISLYGDSGFHCHKTVDYSREDGEGTVTKDSKLCTGAALFLENTRPGGMLANLAFRLGYLRKEIDPKKLSKDVPVYESVDDFVDGASS